ACSLRRSRFLFCTAPDATEIYTLSLHDALPISFVADHELRAVMAVPGMAGGIQADTADPVDESFALPELQRPVNGWRLGAVRHRSEEHTSELQSRENLVCRLLLEKKKKTVTTRH